MPRWVRTGLARRGCRGILALGYHRSTRAEQRLPQLRHPDRFELVYLVQGMQFRAHSGDNHPMHAGQALVIPPGAPHGSGVMPRLPGAAYWLQVAADGPLLDLPPSEATALRRALMAVPHPPVAVDERCRHALDTAADLAGRQRLDPLERTALRHHLLDVLLLCTAPPAAGAGDAALLATLNAAIDRDPQLAAQARALARLVDLSYPRLRARIKAATGQALGDWLMRLRINTAVRLLADRPERPITAIALDLGFSSSQYFATCFRRHTAMSASRFRDELASPEGQRRLRKLRE